MQTLKLFTAPQAHYDTMRGMSRALLVLGLTLLLTPLDAADTLDIYFVDVEGGQATVDLKDGRPCLSFG